ncbi:MAG TPA: ABC transporter ATP-binding protein, partial [Trueperaceae bacterium]|nr:ABC transporter ATP-binding protein [Trueperaceae bacterium]
MGFIMDGLAAEAYDREYSDGQLLRRIVSYFRPYAGAMVVAGLAVFMVASLDALLPIIVSVAIDRVAADRSVTEGFWSRTGGLVLAFLGAAVLSWCFNFVRQWLSARAVGDVVLRLRQDAFDAVMARDMSFYDEFSTGRVVSRVTSDTQDFSQVVTLSLNLVSQLLQVAILFAVLFYVDGRLALLAVAIAPVVVAVALA